MRYLFDHLLIALTILYCIILTILNYNGFFDSPPRHDVARYISPYSQDVTGTVTGIPEDRNLRQVFIVKVNSVAGHSCRGKLLVNYYCKGESVEQGDQISFRCILMRPPPSKNPGGFDYAGYLRRMNIYAVSYISSLEHTSPARTPFYRRLPQIVNQDMNETLQKMLPPAESAVLIPILIGNKQNLSHDEKQAFTDAGVMHVLVVSGLKVAYVAGTFLLLFRVVGCNRRFASLLSIPFLLIYMAATGNNPPVVRATIMAISIFVSLSLNRSSLTYHALALAAAIILIFDPQALFTASFQLSFTATIGIVYLYPYLIKPFQKFPPWFRNPIGGSIAVSLASQLGVMPLLSYYFYKIFIAGIFSNIPIVPLTGVITGLGIVLYLAHFISIPLSALIASIISLLIKLLFALVHCFSGLPYAAVHVATPPIWVVGIYYFLLCGILAARKTSHKFIILGAGLIFIFTRLFISYLAAKDKIEITSLYAGSGTVVHIAFPQNKNLLIDCGRVKDGEAAICPYLWGKGIRKIDMIIITSDDKRRSGGLKSITDNFPVSGIVYPCSITKQIKYFINSSTITLIPSSQGHLTACVDFAGKRTVCMDQDYIPTELEGSTVDVLHISCRRKENPDIIPFIGRIKPCAVILSGTVPKDMPENKNYYILRECGAVSVTINSNGMHIKKFLEGDTSTDEDSEQ